MDDLPERISTADRYRQYFCANSASRRYGYTLSRDASR